MPCGGIYPGGPCGPEDDYPCWVCREKECDLFCDEWDTPLHSRCVAKFLESDEGRIVLAHGHEVVIVGCNGAPVWLHYEKVSG